MDSLTANVIALAKECGFDLVGIATAEPFTARGQTALERTRQGLLDGLAWYTESRVERGTDPHNLLLNARSIISLALSYHAPDFPHPNPLLRTDAESGGSSATGPKGEGANTHPPPKDVREDLNPYLGSVRPEPVEGRTQGLATSPGNKEVPWAHGSTSSPRAEGELPLELGPGAYPLPLGEGEGEGAPRGRIARYAWGEDYHRVFERKVKAFVARLPVAAGRPITTRWYTDTGPMQDRAVAERAGIGWYGKNTNILTRIGSWVLLAHVLTDLDLEPGEPLKKTCGACRLCLDACPTNALVAPGVLDNRRCISFQTIENRGPIPRDLRPLLEDWIFGCDVCQDVCPVNRKVQLGNEYAAFSRDAEVRARPELIGLLQLDEAGFRERFRGSPILRAKLTGLKRNVCVALGNIGDPRAVPALARALREEEPLVRGHAAWALGRIGGDQAMERLRAAVSGEEDPWVLEEMESALGLSPSKPDAPHHAATET